MASSDPKPKAGKTNISTDGGIVVKGAASASDAELLTPQALHFLAKLARRFEPTRKSFFASREKRQEQIDQGRLPGFLPETESVRKGDWKVAPIPEDLICRRVEITGPVDRKMILNALNSGADVFMADFEDSNSPTWRNNLQGQMNLRDAVRRTITFTSPAGKYYELNKEIATLVVRPRGWHLLEKNVLIDGQPISASFFDFGLYFFHNAKELIRRGTGPYFYLPKLEGHVEARLWNEVFKFAQDELKIPQGTIRATVLIETILAGFEMDEILYELREHSSGLNCGRWDYIFSFIKRLGKHPQFVLPDRAQVTMDKGFLKAYVDLLIKTCHRRGVHAMGGMAAQIPIKNDDVANKSALEKVRLDKLREVKAGHDGTWVAHPGLIPIAMGVFEDHMKGPNQLSVLRHDVAITASEMLRVEDGTITESGLRTNINVGILYLEAWLRGSGCVPLYHLMEDAATAEISRTQVWQWIRHAVKMTSGQVVTRATVKKIVQEELAKIKEKMNAEQFKSSKFERAASVFEDVSTQEDFPEFLTLVAYEFID
jgi:malate synthase